ncbi:MAG: PepSY domain-containing protein [Gracilibacteraceae bacterium]|nr:PepSY domain-containing protein [Gracilibacteraceae bacterium]
MKRLLLTLAVFALIALAACAPGAAPGGAPEGAGAAGAEAADTAGENTQAPTVEPEPPAATEPENAGEPPAATPPPASNPPVSTSAASTPATPAPTPPPAPAAPNPAPAGDIGEVRAKEIALAHAGLKESDVVFVRVHLDYDDWRREYEVEFYSGNVEYDYDIDAATGDIRSFDRDAEYYLPPSAGAAAGAGDIGEARAKEIALAHAGYAADGVIALRVKRDYDDGRLEYEVEFYVGNIEYNYEIDAATGTVLNYEAEQDH